MRVASMCGRLQRGDVGGVFFLFRERGAEDGINGSLSVGGGMDDEAVTVLAIRAIKGEDIDYDLARGGANHLDLAQIVPEVNRAFIDSVSFVFLPGDVADDGSRSAYTMVRGELDRLKVPWCATLTRPLPGSSNDTGIGLECEGGASLHPLVKIRNGRLRGQLG